MDGACHAIASILQLCEAFDALTRAMVVAISLKSEGEVTELRKSGSKLVHTFANYTFASCAGALRMHVLTYVWVMRNVSGIHCVLFHLDNHLVYAKADFLLLLQRILAPSDIYRQAATTTCWPICTYNKIWM